MSRLPRSFSYSKSFVAAMIAASCFAYAFPVVIALLAGLIYGQWKDFPKFVAAFASPMGLGLAWLILSAFAIRHTLIHRPVRISAQGIESKWLGQPWRSIAWSSKPAITKRVTFEYESGGQVETIEIADSKYKIRTKSYIEDYAVLKEALNALAVEFDLPIKTIDTSGTKTIVDDGPSVRL